MMTRLALFLSALLILTACAQDWGDLKAELKERSANQKGKVEPLPMLKPQPRFRYETAGLPDPFYP